MKIGIVGAPGAGKTQLAEGIVEALTEQRTFTTVDDYVPALSQVTDVAYGHFAGYVGNFQVAFERLRIEQATNRVFGHTITCGTVIDTMIYAAMYSQFASDNAPDKRAEFARVSTTMHMFGMLVHDTLDYDLIFYLPFTQEHRQEHPGEWNTLLDLEYAGTFVGIGVTPILLDDGDVNNLAKAVQHIFEAINAEPADATINK